MVENGNISFLMNKSKIIKSIEDKDKFIVDICKELNFKRSTLNYYLQKLEIEGIITRKVIESGATGKPTKICLTNSYKKQMARKKEEEEKEMIRVLDKMREEGGEMSYNDYIRLINFENNHGMPFKLLFGDAPFLEQYVRITPEGENFLRQH